MEGRRTCGEPTGKQRTGLFPLRFEVRLYVRRGSCQGFASPRPNGRVLDMAPAARRPFQPRKRRGKAKQGLNLSLTAADLLMEGCAAPRQNQARPGRLRAVPLDS